jgi:gas vesicle protein
MRTGDFLAGVLVGTLIGAALGLAFAPEAGEDTRGRVAEKAREWSDVARERGRTLLRKDEEGAEEGGEE